MASLRALERSGRPYEFSVTGVHSHSSVVIDSPQTVGAAVTVDTSQNSTNVPRVQHSWDSLQVHHLGGTKLDPVSGLVFFGEDVIQESGYGFRSASDGAFLSGAMQRIRRRRFEETTIPLTPAGAVWNYYHFLIETLPRLLHVHDVQPEALPVFGSSLPRYVVEALDASGLPQPTIRLHPLTSDSLFLCDPSPFGWPHPSNVRRLAKLATTVAPHIKQTGTVYVPRLGSSRTLADESALIDEFSDQGATVARLDQMTWVEQVELFRSSERVIAPHGAGLANMVFMKPGSQVIELTTGTWWNPCFRDIAAIVGLEHHLIHLPAYADAPHGRADDASRLLKDHLR